MKVFHHTSSLQLFLAAQRTNGRTVGFVPTMGALHTGHLSLVAHSRAVNTLTVASIFVNPTQFNNAEDLEKYPRTPGRDLELLAGVGCDLAFLPTVAEVYPAGLPPAAPLDFAGLDEVLEGAMRPGHFQGVAQVVERLLALTQPDHLYLGQKDFQQLAILRSLIQQRGLPVAVTMVPTVREQDGLAKSSRNQRLGAVARAQAPALYRLLTECQDLLLAGESPDQVAKWGYAALGKLPGFQAEYLAIADQDRLLPLTAFSPRETPALVAAAAWLDGVRLIDNLLV